MMDEKALNWRGTSLNDVKAFPLDAKKQAGFELNKVQYGQSPTNFKSVNRWGAGVIEIKIKGEDGEYRVIYVAKFAEAVYVLHAFNKKRSKPAQEMSKQS